MSTYAQMSIYDVYANLPTAGIVGRMFYVSTGTNAGYGYYDNGTTWETVITPPGGALAIKGTAVFSPSGGSIASLTVAGCITGVTYTSTGNYVVDLSGAPSDYKVLITCGDSTRNPLQQTSATLTSSSFAMQVVSLSPAAYYDPAWVFIVML